MRGPDGRLRDCYPVIMSFMVDYPEVYLICLVRTNYACPICMVPKKEFSRLDKKYPQRTVLEMQAKIANTFSISKGDRQKADIYLRRDGVWGQTVCI
jgi:Plavaka transposase